MYDFLPVLIFRFLFWILFYLAFLIIGSYIVLNSILGLLSRSLLPKICADSLRRLILQCQPYQLFQLYPIRADGFPFPSIYGPPYPTFQSHLVLLLPDVLLALFLVGDLYHLCIFYHNCKGWSSWGCWIPLWLDPEEIHRRVEPLVNTVLMSYGLHIFWILSASPLT